MAELARRSPLAGLAAVDRGVPGGDPVTLVALPFKGKLILRGGDEVRARAAAAGLALPDALRASTQTEAAALWLGPEEWLLVVAATDVEALAAKLGSALAGVHHAVVDVSDRMTGIRVEGRRAGDVLNAGCPLDLHPLAFAAGAVTRTLLGKAPIVLHRPGTGSGFELWVNGSFAPYAWRFLENAAREHGYRVVA